MKFSITWLKNHIGTIIFGLLNIFVILNTYKSLSKVFFQQDEWASLGLVMAQGPLGLFYRNSFIEVLAGKERIFGSLINNYIHFFFPFRVEPFFIFSIVVHWVNTMLVFILVRLLTKNITASFVAGFFFSICATASGALLWFSSHTTVLPNGFFVILSLYFFFSYIQKDKSKWLVASHICVVMSFLFKETSVFLFFLLPLFQVLYKKRNDSIMNILWKNSYFFIYFLFIVIVRGIDFFSVAVKSGVVFVTSGTNPLVRFIIHLLSYPILSLSQIFIPPPIMFKLAGFFQQIQYEFINVLPLKEAITNILVSDFLSLFFSIIIVFVVILLIHLHKKTQKVLLFCLIFSLMSFTPFAVLDRPWSSYLESRYFYNGIIGACIILGIIFNVINSKIQKTHALLHIFGIGALCVGLSFYFFKNSIFIQRDINREIITASERIHFLESIKKIRGDIPEKPVFFISGDSPGFYGLADLSVPFQQGMGYTLMVWNFDSGLIPKELLSEGFLWNINEQGYREVEGKGFGYFWSKDSLINEFKKNRNLRKNQLIGFHYIASEKKLIDLTEQTKEEIE